ncbi:MAG: hypothetical protein OXD43_07420, partial [Bacteroidetes bacterium]|nr:hypothetical protein [Bacteroidota bacterium]
TKPFCEKTREIWVKTHEFGAKSALLDGKMGKMSTEISNSSNGVAKMGLEDYYGKEITPSFPCFRD